MSDCIFCKIVKGEIPVEKVYQDEKVIGFKDIHPQAETHLLFVHKDHSADIVEMMENNPDAIKDVMNAISAHAKESGLCDRGFRIVTNVGESAGQSVFHAHFHVLSHARLGQFGK